MPNLFVPFIRQLTQVTECDSSGQTPLHIAAFHGHQLLVNLLLTQGIYSWSFVCQEILIFYKKRIPEKNVC